MYPINTLRNIALSMCRSDYVFLVDVDFIPSANLHNNVMKSRFFGKYFLRRNESRNITLISNSNSSSVSASSFLRRQDNVALVLPAFELIDSVVKNVHIRPQGSKSVVWNMSDDHSIPQEPADLWLLFRKEQARPFHGQICKHWYFFFIEWMNSILWSEYKSEYYAVEYDKNYEPYIITKRKGLRKYDERFRGYGLNKVIHIKMLAKLDFFRFFVYGNGFVISKEHNKTQDGISWRTDLKKRKCMQWLGDRINEEIAAGIGTPTIT
ncbi:hypothetical protein RFI_19779 [Reticulomyxa filosa]|uniref:Uncharacterized protein n=1 Tax=Reticulomyxa filosa TaxID=46433 RepID=X6MWT3_RETFI|nr:hypothetical protein RFI_19779 [Reticulomyxa filosa]|eukprot:ETO17545.1 hypothetical protein RFI_19779 [Reticulomyxa filosa]